jgi:hypothetical protein
MISFLSPLFLLGALAAAVPIVLHLLKREPEARVKFSAVRLLRRAPVEHTARRRLRELLLLAMRVTALLLLAVAFARPFFASGDAAASGGITIVALDTSFSLAAPGRFERARQLAKEAIGRAPAGDLVGVVTFADEAALAAGPSIDRGVASAAVDAAAPGFGATRYRAALNLAGQTISARSSTASGIVLVTDLQESGWDAGEEAALPESARLELVDVGAAPPNLAVTAVRPTGERLAVVIRNTGPTLREARVRLTVDGRPAGDLTASAGPGQSAEVAFPAIRGGTAAVEVEDREGIQADNVRYAVLDSSSRPSVLVVTSAGELAREAFYLQQALGARGREGSTYDVQGVAGSQLSAWEQPRLNSYAAVVVMSTRGLDRRGRELLLTFVQAGGGLLLAAGAEIDDQVATDTLGGVATVTAPDAAAPDRAEEGSRRRLAAVDPRHPVFRAFGPQSGALGVATFDRIAAVKGGSGCQTLARFTTGETALIDCVSGEGHALIVASDVNNSWNDLPRHAAFVPFVHEAVRYLSGVKTRSSEYLVGDVPPGIPRQPGIATTDASAASRQVAVNVDVRESDPARLSPDEFMTAVTRLKKAAREELRVEERQQEEHQRIWQYLLAVMLGMMAIESLVAAKTT